MEEKEERKVRYRSGTPVEEGCNAGTSSAIYKNRSEMSKTQKAV